MGRDWLKEIKLDWKVLRPQNSVNKLDEQLHSVLEDHADVFRDELGLLRDVKVSLQISPDTQPSYHRPRPVPYALRSRVEAELTRLEEDGVIEAVAHSDWAAPIVTVITRDGAIRICGDFKVTINQVAKQDMYPLPKVDDLLSTLARGRSFLNWILAMAAPSIFQRTMENLLKDIPNVVA